MKGGVPNGADARKRSLLPRKAGMDEHLAEEKPAVGCWFITRSILRTDTLADLKPDDGVRGRL